MDRRTFIKGAAAMAAGVSTLSSFNAISASSKKRALVLGGRDFFGPTIVKQLIANGYEVTLFNRGFTNPDMFKDLTWIRGDRDIRDGSGLANLKAHLKKTTYDLVIDTWQKQPLPVLEMAKLLKGKIGQYQYVSSISVYKDKEHVGIDENYPLLDVSGVEIDGNRFTYAQAKTLSEMSLFDVLGDRTVSFRSHGMRSDRTPNRIYEPYWPVRFYRGGNILLPEDDNHVMQVCDVPSMSQFMIHSHQQGYKGAYNVAYKTRSFTDYLSLVEKVTRKEHNKIWVPKDFLAKHDIEPYKNLPFWRPQLKGFYHINVNKAHQAGLENRSVTEMVKDQLTGYLRRNPTDEYMFGGRGTISPWKEKQVLDAWALES